MGRAGRKPTPTKIKIARGTARKRPAAKREPEPGPAGWAMPASIKSDKHAKDCWEYHHPILDRLGLLTESDYQQFVILCQSWGEYQMAMTELKKKGGYVAISSNGSEYPSPYFNIKNKALDRIQKCCQHFGLSPADRSSLSVKPKQQGGVAAKLRQRNQG